MRLAFAGTPAFASVALEALIAARFEIALVLTQPDRPAGRGLRLQASAVKEVAQRHGLPVVQPHGLRFDGRYGDEARVTCSALEAARIDAMVVAAYGLILPGWVLALPRLGCFNIHASLLPRWRGAAPIHRAIEAGDVETGITIMQMDEGLDTGDMLLTGREPIRSDDTTASLHDRLAALGGRLIVEALAAAATGQLVPRAQPQEGVTYAHKIDKRESAIDWSEPAAVIGRRVRAFDPFPGASFQFEGEIVKLWRTAPAVGQAAPGTRLPAAGDALRIACGDGALDLLQLQRPGGKRVDGREFLASRPSLAVGTRL